MMVGRDQRLLAAARARRKCHRRVCARIKLSTLSHPGPEKKSQMRITR